MDPTRRIETASVLSFYPKETRNLKCRGMGFGFLGALFPDGQNNLWGLVFDRSNISGETVEVAIPTILAAWQDPALQTCVILSNTSLIAVRITWDTWVLRD